MIRKILLPIIFLILAYGFWLSPDFKEIAAGVAIFLFGMIALEEGFKAFSGGLLERILRQTTDKLWKSLSFGIISTSVMQSSSLVSVLTISFLSAGLIGLSAGIGIIFGANLGTTTGAWLIAGFGLKVKISAYAMPMLVFGVILIFQKSKSLKGVGYVLAGLGFLFLGIHYMKEGFDAFKGALDLEAYAIPGFKGLLVFSLIGVIATVVMQSSHATLVLIITALAAQQVTYDNALALAIGANVGTTVTAIIGAMSANVDGKRLAAAHFIFNIVTGLIAVIGMQQLILLVDFISAWVGIAGDDYTLKLAVFHTLFNLLGVVVMMPFISLLVQFLNRLFKAPKQLSAQPVHPRYLNDAVMEYPEAVLESVRKETFYLYENALEVIARGIYVSPRIIRSNEDLAAVIQGGSVLKPVDIDAQYARKIKVLHAAILTFVSRAQSAAPPEFAEQLLLLRDTSRNIVEIVKGTKHLQKNLTRYCLSDNPDIREEYNRIRIQLANILRRLNEFKEGKEATTLGLSLDVLRLDIEKQDAVVNGSMDRLIRENLISAEMATSLMNDTGYAYQMANKLVDVGGVLFSQRNQAMMDAERSVALDPDDIEALAKGRAD